MSKHSSFRFFKRHVAPWTHGWKSYIFYIIYDTITNIYIYIYIYIWQELCCRAPKSGLRHTSRLTASFFFKMLFGRTGRTCPFRPLDSTLARVVDAFPACRRHSSEQSQGQLGALCLSLLRDAAASHIRSVHICTYQICYIINIYIYIYVYARAERCFLPRSASLQLHRMRRHQSGRVVLL